MQQQLKLFTVQEPLFEDVTNNWLLEYLQNEYPEMKFKKYKYFDKEIVGATYSPKVFLSFKVVRRAEKEYWCRKTDVYISINGQKNYGSFEGFGYGVDSIEEFKKDALNVVERCKKWLKEFNDRTNKKRA